MTPISNLVHSRSQLASVQTVTEEIVLRLTRSLAEEFKIPNLCLAGGVALNCVANGKVLRDAMFNDIWVQPAAGDAGGALGAALAAWYQEMGNPRAARQPDSMRGAYLGPVFQQDEIDESLTACGAVFASRNDGDFQILLRAINDAQKHLNEITRFSMPNFRPEPEYVREMIRYGILPADFDSATDPINVYETDRRYWESLWHPGSKSP